MKKLTKKKSRFEVFLEESEMFLTLLACTGIALFGFLDYWLARLECSLIVNHSAIE